MVENLVRACNWEFGKAALHLCEQATGLGVRVNRFTPKIGTCLSFHQNGAFSNLNAV